MKESGFNAIRSAHYPIGKNMLRACDELGMYIMDEAFDKWRDTNGLYGFQNQVPLKADLSHLFCAIPYHLRD